MKLKKFWSGGVPGAPLPNPPLDLYLDLFHKVASDAWGH